MEADIYLAIDERKVLTVQIGGCDSDGLIIMGMVYEKCMEVKYSGIAHVGLNSLSLSFTRQDFPQMFHPITAANTTQTLTY